MYQLLDGPATQGAISVTDAVVAEVKVGSSPLSERKVITLQGDGKFYVYFGNGVAAPSAPDVIADGFIQYKDAKESYEAGETQRVYILALEGTVEVRISERA